MRGDRTWKKKHLQLHLTMGCMHAQPRYWYNKQRNLIQKFEFRVPVRDTLQFIH